MSGRPVRYWIGLFALTHRSTAHGWARMEWPDGKALWVQPWHQVSIMRIIADELDRIQTAQNRQATKR